MSAPPSLPTPAEVVAQPVVNYYHQLTAFTIPLRERAAWYTAQLPEQQALLSKLAPAKWEVLPTFRRHALEARGDSRLAYMTAHLTADQLTHWVDDGDGGVRP